MATYDKNFDVEDIQALFLNQLIELTRFKTARKTQKSESLGFKRLGTMKCRPFLTSFIVDRM